MPTRFLGFLMVACALLTAATAQAQWMRGTQFSGAVGLNLPLGELDKQARAGIDVAIRTLFTDPAQPWGVRNSLTFDRFGGKTVSGIDNYQFLGLLQFELVHSTNKKLYQYVGVGLYQFKATFHSTSGPPPTIGRGDDSSISEGDVGFQGGVGLNFGTTTKTFLELGVVNVLTSGKSSSWFPLRFGIRI